jgi:hypothetical protein
MRDACRLLTGWVFMEEEEEKGRGRRLENIMCVGFYYEQDRVMRLEGRFDWK